MKREAETDHNGVSAKARKAETDHNGACAKQWEQLVALEHVLAATYTGLQDSVRSGLKVQPPPLNILRAIPSNLMMAPQF
eukprot:1437085-Rhodomonas_salina.3